MITCSPYRTERDEIAYRAAEARQAARAAAVVGQLRSLGTRPVPNRDNTHVTLSVDDAKALADMAQP